MNKKYLNVPYYIWGLFLVSSLVFIFFPQIDIFVTSLFYEDGTFPANKTWLEEFFYHSVQPIIIALSLASLALFAYNFFTKKAVLNINAKVVLYLLLVLGLAPGLIVNATLKDNWGRARPAETLNFGGTKEFTPAFIPSTQGGYSFSSGHAAAAFSLIGFALLAKNRRKFWMTLALAYGVFVSIARVSAGGHFFSDVVTSFFIVYIFTYIFYGLLIKEKSDA
ncbi:phosphatase PAP2 family protein [bacterium]|nr:phosphatase PAP2 family protein [bacterium]MBU1991050.1 phosphatase PAP2 family protein [bacterium]